MNWEATVNVPVPVLAMMVAVIAFCVMGVFRKWIVPAPFYREQVQRGDEERKAKEDALSANKTLIESNLLLLRRDDISITTLVEIRDYIHRHDPPSVEGGGSP